MESKGTKMGEYKAVFKGGQGEITEKKSRFIAQVQAANTVEEAQAFIDAVKKEHWDARHNCYAFCVGDEPVTSRCSDDGEPGGTAGKPILEVILGSGIRNIVIVVTRYFGGTLLGTGGLIRAYTEAAKAGIADAVILDKISGIRCEMEAEYTDLGKIRYILSQNDVITEKTDYTDKVILQILFSKKEREKLEKELRDGTGGKVGLPKGETVSYGLDGDVAVIFRENR